MSKNTKSWSNIVQSGKQINNDNSLINNNGKNNNVVKINEELVNINTNTNTNTNIN